MSYQYTDKAAVQSYILRNIDVSFDTQLTEWINAMSEYIDNRVGYPVFTDTATERLYDGSGQDTQIISPVNTITVITVDDVVVTPLIGPYNIPTKSFLKFRDNYFTEGLANVSVTGKHCLTSTLPNDIKLACTILVAGIVNQSENQTDGVKSEKIGEYAVTYNTEDEQKQYKWAKEAIEKYRVISF